ncbi:MAG TPA: MASE1 domain-containing protein, partial [Burkholderiaceae bacterium]|nr:MASE1 domain-containing protein [Burkholderiaceae bacterium]
MQTENRFGQTWDRPGWQVYLLLPALHYVTIQISFYCGKTPENEVIIWLPNAVLLTALLLFRGQGGWLMAAITFASNVIGNLPTAPPSEAVLLSIVNLIEIILTYLLMRYAGFSSRFTHMEDFAKFVIAGPVISAFVSGLLAAAVIVAYGASTSYFTLMRVWWFDDGLGLLIFAPLLMLATVPADEPVKLRFSDIVVLLLTIGLLGMMFIPRHDEIADLPLTPTLLIPSMLFLAMRFGIFWASLGVALVSLTVSRLAAIGNRPFGGVNLHETVIHTQEFILTFSVICMGAAILRSQLRSHERNLEKKVHERTLELSTSLQQLQYAQKDLVQSEKLASLGVLVAGVSHELNTPIGNAVTGVSVLQHRMEETRKNLITGKLGRSELTH